MTCISAPVHRAFEEMRDRCPHYGGHKVTEGDERQCSHPDNPNCGGNWCAIEVCPPLRWPGRVEIAEGTKP